MGVFLRWGVFGILAVAALVYAYNALGHLADRRKAAPAPVSAPIVAPPVADAPAPVAAPTSDGDASAQVPARCVVEIDIARRSVESRSIGEPLDRLLRIQEIAWEKDEQRRARLVQVATRWFETPGPVDAERLRRDALDDCLKTGS